MITGTEQAARPPRRAKVPAALITLAALISGCAAPSGAAFRSLPATEGGAVVFRSAAAENQDPFKAGRAAAAALKIEMGRTRLRAIIVYDCFEEEALKEKALAGVASVFPGHILFGAATYGAFTQEGCLDLDSVALLGVGGAGIGVSAALEKNMGAADLSLEKDRAKLARALGAAGQRLARKLPRAADNRLLILLGDAHSPRNALLIDGVHKVLGKDFPIAGGSVNKNQGQSFVYYRGRMYADSAVGVMLSGDFKVSLAGRQAKSNEKVISSARGAASEAMKNLKGVSLAVLAFNCAGRKGKLKRIEDELEAIQGITGRQVPLFGCYCAGEFGPADTADKTPGVLSSGCGRHVMFTFIGR